MSKITNNSRKRMFITLFAAISMGVAGLISINHKTPVETKATQVVSYTLDLSKATAISDGEISSTYDDVDTVTLTDETTSKEWNLYGSNTNNYAVAGTRFGGKNAGVLASALSNAPTGITTGTDWYVMYIAGTSQFGTAINKIEVTSIATFGTASFVVGKKMFLQVSPNSDFSSSTIYSDTMAAVKTITFNAPTEWAASSYYRIVMERNSTSKSNSGIILSTVKFYTEVEETIPVTSVSITPPVTTSLTVGDKVQLATTVLPVDASDKSLEWETSNANVAVVSQTGLVMAINNGTVKITAKSAADPTKSAYVDFTVSGLDTSTTTKTITATGLGLTTTYTNGYYGSGITYSIRGVMKESSTGALQFGNNAGAGQGLIYNASPYGNPIKNIVISAGVTGATKTTSLYVGTSPNPTTNLVTPTVNSGVWTYNVAALGDFTYFSFGITETTGTNYYDSIVVSLLTDDVVTLLEVDPTSKSYFTTDTLQETDFDISITKNEEEGTSADYTAKIGTGTGSSFSGTAIVWGTTKPSASDTTIQFEAKYPTVARGSTYLTAEVALTVTVPSIVSIDISGSLTKTHYYTIDAWSPLGLVVTATYDNDATQDVTSSVTWSYDPATPNSETITSVEITASLAEKIDSIAENVTVTTVTSPTNFKMDVHSAYANAGDSTSTLTEGADILPVIQELTPDLLTSAIAQKDSPESSVAVYYAGTNSTKNSIQPLKLGSGSYKGNIKLTFTDEIRITSVTLFAARLGVGATNATLQVNEAVAQSIGTVSVADEMYAPYTFEGAFGNEIVIRTNSNYAVYLFGIDIEYTTALEDATAFASEVMTGSGLGAKNSCEAVLDSLNDLYDELTEAARIEFENNPDELFVNARARMAYLTAWVAANDESGSKKYEATNGSNSVMATVMIGVIGLSSIVGYYYLTKKKRYY